MRYEDLIHRLSEGSGIGIGTIKKTLREYKSTGKVSSPQNKKVRRTICEKVDGFDKKSINFGLGKKFQRYQKLFKPFKMILTYQIYLVLRFKGY